MKNLEDNILTASVETNLELTLASRSSYLRSEERTERIHFFSLACIYLAAAIKFTALVTKEFQEELIQKLKGCIWEIAEDLSDTYAFGFGSLIEENSQKLINIKQCSALFALVVREKEMVECWQEVVDVAKKAEDLGINIFPYDGTIGFNGKKNLVELYASSKKILNEEAEKVEDKIREFVEKLMIFPEENDRKLALRRFLEESIKAQEKNMSPNDIFELTVNDDYSFKYKITHENNSSMSSAGSAKDVWKEFLDKEIFEKISLLRTGQLTDEFAFFTGETVLGNTMKTAV